MLPDARRSRQLLDFVRFSYPDIKTIAFTAVADRAVVGILGANCLLDGYFEKHYGEKEIKREIRRVLMLEGEAQRRSYSHKDSSIQEYHGANIFLCHAGEDSKFTTKLAKALNSKGVPVWFDKWELKPTDSICKKISQGIRKSRFMGVVLSKNSVNRPWCQQEMNVALQMNLKNKKRIKILPILIDNCRIPILFHDLFWADFRSSFTKGLDSIMIALRSVRKTRRNKIKR
jgi:hypothetical protein